MGRRARALSFVVAIFAVTAGLLAPPAGASVGAASLTLNPAFGPPTSKVIATGNGFGAAEKVVIRWDGRRLGSAVTDGNGAFTRSVSVPRSARPGDHDVNATGKDSGRSATASFLVRTDWPEFRFDAAHSGSNPYENVLSPSNVSQLEPAWRFGTDGLVSTAPAIWDGVVYEGSGRTDHHLYAISASSGKQVWAALAESLLSSPSIADGVAYIGAFDGSVNAYDAVTGTRKWLHITQGQIYSSPTVVDGVVYVGDMDDEVYALDGATGKADWTFDTTGSVEGSPAVVDGVVYVGAESGDGNVYAIDASTGAERWAFPTGGSVEASPAVVGGVVFVGTTAGAFYALDASTGAMLWSSPVGGTSSSAAVVDGVVYVGTNAGLVALDASTGGVLWSFAGGPMRSSPAVANGVVYIGSDNGILYAFDASDGTKLWSVAIKDTTLSSPAVVNGMVFVGSHDKKIYAYALP